MIAFQVLWSKPLVGGRHISALSSKFSDKTSGFCFPDYCVLLVICSVLAWRRHSGNIRLYTDEVFAEKLDNIGILKLWDNFDLDVLGSIGPSSINPSIFWNAGKLAALQAQQAPCICFDTDLIVWRSLHNDLAGADVAFTHWESPTPRYWYCRRRDLSRPLGYRFSRAWNWSPGLVANTSLMYFEDESFKSYYAEQAFRYMRGNQIGTCLKNPRCQKCFLRNSACSPCAARNGTLTPEPSLMPYEIPKTSWFTKHDSRYGEWLFFELHNNTPLTHAWIYKRHIEDDREPGRHTVIGW